LTQIESFLLRINTGDIMQAATNSSGGARLNTMEEVMERLRIGRSTAFELISSQQLRSIKVGRRRLVSEAALTEFIERLDCDSPE
jgi:excisionase family DNA binding protein